jgi:hypothetical protein
MPQNIHRPFDTYHIQGRLPVRFHLSSIDAKRPNIHNSHFFEYSIMSKQPVEWSAEALARLNKAPFFVRRFARNKVEKAALALGETRISLALFEAIKQKEMEL